MKASGLGLALRPASFTVLPLNAPCRAAERLWYVSGGILNGHFFSVACARQPSGFVVHTLTADSLTSPSGGPALYEIVRSQSDT